MLTTINLLIHEHTMFFHLLVFSLITLSGICSYQRTGLIHISLNLSLKYCLFLYAIVNGILNVSVSKC